MEIRRSAVGVYAVSLMLLTSAPVIRAQVDSTLQPGERGRASLSLPVMPVAQALEDRNHDTVPDRLLQPIHVRAVVTIGSGIIADDRTQLYVQDATGGLYIFSRNAQLPRVKAGDIVDVGGTLDQYRGSVQIVRPYYKVIGRTNVPKAIPTNVREAASWRYYGRLVEVAGTIQGRQSQGVNLALQLTDGDTSIDLVFPPHVIRMTRFSDYQPGTRVVVTGVASIYSLDRPYRQGFRLIIGSPGAVRVTRRALPASLRWTILALLVAIPVAALILYLVVRLRRAGRSRTRQVTVINEVSGTVTSAGLDVESLLRQAVDVMARHDLINGAMVHLVDGAQLQLRGIFGVERERAREVDEQIHERLTSALVTRTPAGAVSLPGLHPLLCIPLHGRSRTVGVLTAFTASRHTPSPDEASTIAAAANVIALGIENIQVLQEAEHQQEELKQLAITDPLTTLYNRRFLDEYLRIHLPMARRQSAPVSFISLDLDHFKRVNDTYGHEAGDVLLREVGKTIRRLTRASDLPVRLGGEEFLVVMPDTPQSGAFIFAGRLQHAIRETEFDVAGMPADFRLTASFGIAVYPDHGGAVRDLLRAADRALYDSKRAGRDCISVAPATLRVISAESMG